MGDRDDDRDAILSRRSFLVASALAQTGLGAACPSSSQATKKDDPPRGEADASTGGDD